MSDLAPQNLRSQNVRSQMSKMSDLAKRSLMSKMSNLTQRSLTSKMSDLAYLRALVWVFACLRALFCVCLSEDSSLCVCLSASSIHQSAWHRLSLCSQNAGLPGAAGDHHLPAGDVPVPAPHTQPEAGAWLGQACHHPPFQQHCQQPWALWQEFWVQHRRAAIWNEWVLAHFFLFSGVCVRVCVCVCERERGVFVCESVCANMYVYVWESVCVYVFVCMWERSMYVWECLCIYMRMCMWVDVCGWMYVCVCACMCTMVAGSLFGQLHGLWGLSSECSTSPHCLSCHQLCMSYYELDSWLLFRCLHNRNTWKIQKF